VDLFIICENPDNWQYIQIESVGHKAKLINTMPSFYKILKLLYLSVEHQIMECRHSEEDAMYNVRWTYLGSFQHIPEHRPYLSYGIDAFQVF
jgi:hypothetical protein